MSKLCFADSVAPLQDHVDRILATFELLWIGVGIATLKFSFNICDNPNLCLRANWKGETWTTAFCSGTFISRKVKQNTPNCRAIQFSSQIYEQKLSDLPSKGRSKPYILHIYIYMYFCLYDVCKFSTSSLELF